MPECVCITTTTETEEQAKSLSTLLVEKRLAACVQISPIKSIYRWKGKVESAGEFRLVAKTRAELGQSVIDAIKANHAYEVPEIVVTEIVDGAPEYLQWIQDETQGDGD